jgi:general secretion pathway protein L
MMPWGKFNQLFVRWIDATAEFIAGLNWRFKPPSTITLDEVAEGEFILPDNPDHGGPTDSGRIRIADGQIVDTVPDAVAARLLGSRVELNVHPDRFLFQPFELPKGATEFLAGIVRAQIDRLTPWPASEAAFGWSKPAELDADRMIVTIAATARALVLPYVGAMASLGAQSIAVFTAPQEQEPINILVEDKAARLFAFHKIREVLVFILIAAASIAGVAVSGSTVVGIGLAAQQHELAHRIAQIRAAAGVSRDATLHSREADLRRLEDRKHVIAPNVIVLETLSRILPDNTYLTELRVEDNKVQLSGITHDAPALIGLIEQSGLFTRATFLSPTTRLSDSSERFHIEALIRPAVAAGS